MRTRPRPSVELMKLTFFKTHERGFFAMRKNIEKPTEKRTPPVMREYDIGGTKYIVKATFRDGEGEDAVAILRRIMRNDLDKKAANK